MKEIQERFVRLRNGIATKLRSSRANADFLKALLDRFEGKDPQTEPSKPHSQLASVQANTTETVFEVFAQREEEKVDFQCQWPGRELDAPACQQVLSPTDRFENFFICGQESLVYLLLETARGCQRGS